MSYIITPNSLLTQSKSLFNSITMKQMLLTDVFSDKLVEMTDQKIIAPYFIVEQQRAIIDIYRDMLIAIKSGGNPNLKAITDAQKRLNFAIDHAKVNNLPTSELESLKNDVNHLKYELI